MYERLVEAFEGLGVQASQVEIARRLGLGRSAVAKWANGTGFPVLRRVIEAAEIAGVSVEWLLTGRGPKRPETGSYDALTEELLSRWSNLPERDRREVLDYIRFKLTRK